MLFAFYGFDKKAADRLRASRLTAHLDYLRATKIAKLAGPLLDESGAMIGTLLVLETENLQEAEAWLRDEPFCHAGLFREQKLLPWLNMHCRLEKR